MSRRRSVVSAEPQPEPQQQQPEASAELRGGAMEPTPGAAAADADDFLELEPDEELLCSVSDITEQLGRSVAAALDTALSEIRLMVSVRIRVLKAELRDKSDEIAALKARLGGALHRDPSEAADPCFPGPPAEAACRKAEAGAGGSRLGVPEPRRGKAAPLGVKKENIDAICDYLMKDKNSRGSCSGGGGDERPDAGEQQSPEPHSLHLWPDGGVAPGAGAATATGAGPPDAESGTDELFSMLPSSSKRIYDYEWMAPMDYSSELRVMKEPDGENTPSGETEDDDDDDDDDGSSRREEHQLEQSLPHAQPPNFSMDPHSSPGGGASPLEGIADGPDPGPQFPSHTYICSLCGTFCPDSVFLEEHIKLIHSEAAGLQALQALQSTSGASAATLDGGGGGGGEPRRLGQGQGQGQGQAAAGPLGGGPGPGSGPGPVKREIKIEGGYECGDCGRHFNYLGNLRQHQRIHTGEKPFMCPECGERFRHAARLKSHRLVHSGAQSPFPCPQCGKGFSVLSGLKRHQRVHTGESPYACPQCGRRFKELGNLYTHQRIHSGATPYCCTQCGRSFRHLGTYKSHRCTPPQ